MEKKEGKLKGHKDVVIMDLPGIYSLSPYTLEEVVARNYLIGERPDAIINIVDGTNISVICTYLHRLWSLVFGNHGNQYDGSFRKVRRED